MGRGELLMYLAEAQLNRDRAASMAGVSRRTLQRAMRRHRIKAPRSDAKLDAALVAVIRAVPERACPCASIAKQSGVHRNTIQRARSMESYHSTGM